MGRMKHRGQGVNCSTPTIPLYVQLHVIKLTHEFLFGLHASQAQRYKFVTMNESAVNAAVE